ncbi:MAG TPA: hypothetical protein VEW74_07355, partial [Candidatus Nitrosotalea sp.]|nr:hypothetical protein [Candidatus Nitrosotalea sp.]
AMLFAATGGIAAAQETPIQTVSAFKSTVSYRFGCTRDVFTVAIGAQSQVADGAQTALYWAIWDSGQTASGAVQNLAMLNTLAVQAVGATPQTDGSPAGSVVTKVYRSCANQSLYIWAGTSTTTLPNGDVVVHFSDAVEQALKP